MINLGQCNSTRNIQEIHRKYTQNIHEIYMKYIRNIDTLQSHDILFLALKVVIHLFFIMFCDRFEVQI